MIPTDPGLCDVNYACLLIPRVASQVLDGDLADYLKREIPNIFIAHGWLLKVLEIEPTHLQWLVSIPPSMAPEDHIHVVRQLSSQLILTNFAKFDKKKYIRDYWAPGYLLSSGKQLIPREGITAFIQMNRERYYCEENPLTDPVA